MSKYTIELRKICDIYSRDVVESWFKNYELSDYLTTEQIATIQKANIWSKDKLACKIVDFYYMREIGLETPALFKHYAKIYMKNIMERKLPLIYSSAIKYDPLVNVDYTETYEREFEGKNINTGLSNSSSSNSASGLNVGSDTPQGQINKNEILSGKYASQTNASETSGNVNDKTDTESHGNSNTNENYTKRVKGNSGVSATAQKMVEQFRDNIIAIDEQIINELNKLFMGLY